MIVPSMPYVTLLRSSCFVHDITFSHNGATGHNQVRHYVSSSSQDGVTGCDVSFYYFIVEICERTDTDRQTYGHAGHITLHPYWGQSDNEEK